MSLSITAGEGSISGCTRVEVVERCTYDWVIEDFKFFPQQNGECIYSPIFRMCNNEVEWKLCLFPRSDDRNTIYHASFDLCLHSHKSKTIKIEVDAEISILPVGIKRELKKSYEAKGACWFDRSIERSELCAQDVITIRCNMQMSLKCSTELDDAAQSMEQALNSQAGQLSQDFHLLFKDPKFSDFAVIVRTQKFPAHKLILATRSPVFAAMFEHKETQENLKNEVKIENMEPEVVKAMLEFIYTDEVANLEELAYGLLEAADKYDLQRLRNMCEKILYKTVNKENAVEILIHADLHRSHNLKKYVMEFVDEYLFDVVGTECYKKLWKNYPELLNELVCTIAFRKKSTK